MQNGHLVLKKARFYSSVSILYLGTLLFGWYLVKPYSFTSQKPQTLAHSVNINQIAPQELLPNQTAVTGTPIRLVISNLQIDLPVDEGNYDEANQTWTLSARHAHFASPSMLANNIRGNTLIYGHYNVYVFYNLKHIQPSTVAEVHTENAHVFTYRFKESEDLKPDDVTVFDYQSYPRLTIQTCSGSFYEYRRMYYFSLTKVDGRDV